MEQAIVWFKFALVVGGLLSIFLSFYAWKKIKNAPGGKYFIVLSFLAACLSFGYFFELSSPTLAQIKFWLRVEYLALPFIPVFILLMCLDYVGHKLRKLYFYFLFLIPIMTIFMHFTNDLHHLYYSSMQLRDNVPLSIVDLDRGPWFYVHSLFLYLCITLSTLTLLMELKGKILRFQLQLLTMVAGLLVPILASVFYINDLSPYGVDLGPVSLAVSSIFHLVALLSFQMFDVSPIARDTVFENMADGVIILNKNKVIVDYNKAMLNTLPVLSNLAIGKTICQVIDDPILHDVVRSEIEQDYQWEQDGRQLHFHVRFSPLYNNKQQIGEIISFVNVTERVIMQEKLRQLASIDGLTQVYNRTFFMHKFEDVFNGIQVEGGYLSVIMFDIDHFKQVNDTYGHEAGDIVLSTVAKLTKERLQKTEIIGRYGGEEFIICMPHRSLDAAYNLANMIRKEIESSSIVINGQEITVTASFGVTGALIQPDDPNQTIHSLMRQADHALYAAKNSKRNCVHTV